MAGTDNMPFHEGERRMHELTGVAEQILPRGQAMIRSFMPDQHRSFFAKLPFVLAGGLDQQLQPWATVWTGEPGFMESPEPTVLRIRPHALPHDPLRAALREESPVGLLGIEPHTRRRNRMNGVLKHLNTETGAMHIDVRQSFGNCPKYITPRQIIHQTRQGAQAVQPAQALGPSAIPQAIDLIRRSDTLFIASASADTGLQGLGTAASGVDVSHRGGPPGFVHDRLSEEGQLMLTLPDYSGNFMFNTLGNILQNPKVGLLFMDFERADVLWLACLAQVDLDSQPLAAHPGAQRLVHLQVEKGWWAPHCLPLAVVQEPESSPP